MGKRQDKNEKGKTSFKESRSKMDSERKAFYQVMEALNLEVGEKAVKNAYLVFIAAVNWLRRSGHGDLTISATKHIFGLKFRADTVISVDDEIA